ncbi:uncharacterized protein LOC131018856 [Salvia miltiorrhiza]|uniref:uncharacterized protein LOC131018856 n=1 Tax=Salvia miltiorrhiza TaxID=226208 RepID=UPI0025ACD031|nr:uncharacterized protein LOC131018856 [Salvia miltiorrhiza]
MQKELFLRIADGEYLLPHETRCYRPDSLTSLQKCTMVLRKLATGISVDTFDEYLKIADTTGRLCLKKFCKAFIKAYNAEYLRPPTLWMPHACFKCMSSGTNFLGCSGAWIACIGLERISQRCSMVHLQESPLFADALEGTTSPVIFQVNQRYYHMGYYLCGGIYPKWPTFVKSPLMASNAKEARFKKMQEAQP